MKYLGFKPPRYSFFCSTVFLIVLFSFGIHFLHLIPIVQADSTLTTELESFWKLDEASGTRIDDVGSNNLTSNNSVGQAIGIVGNAAAFNAASQQTLNITDNESLSTGGTDFTISAWVYLTSKSSLQSIVSKFQSTGTGEYAIYYNSSDDKFHCVTYGNGTQYDAIAIGSPSLNTWYNIVCAHDATAHTNTIQVNNGTVYTKTGANEHANSTADFVIGGFGSPASLYLNGRVDAVGFWKRKLTTDEVSALYNGGYGLEYPFTLPTSPTAISNLDAFGEDEQVTLNWTAPFDGGSAITDYTIEYKPTSSGTWTTFPDGVSTATTEVVTSLTNGLSYDFRVFAVNANGSSPSSNIVTEYPMGVLFQDNFDTLSNGAIAGQNGWINGGGGEWTIGSGGSGKIVTSTNTSYPTNYITQGNPSWTNQRVKVDFQAGSSAPVVWLRKQGQTGNTSGYLLYMLSNTWYLSKHYDYGTGLVNFTNAVTPITLTNGDWYTVEFSVADNSNGNPVLNAYIYAQGEVRPEAPFMTFTETGEAFKEGYVALGAGGAATAYDNLTISGTTNENLTLIAPAHRVASASAVATLGIINDDNRVFYIPYIQTSTTLNVEASVGDTVLPAGGGVKFTVNAGLPSEESSVDMLAPFQATFSNLAKGTYTVSADVVDASQIIQIGTGKHDAVSQVGIGDIYTAVGDSITAGFYGTDYGTTYIKDWLNAPVGSTSTDNRNFPQYHQIAPASFLNSFMKDLNVSFSPFVEYPIFIRNEGRSGATATSFASAMTTASWINRQAALHPNGWLVHLGVNDASSVNASTFKTNMQALINSAINTYGISPSRIYLARTMYSKGEPKASTEATYLPIVDALIAENGLRRGPDFYNYFFNYQNTYYNDSLHPNQAGISQMARLWNVVMIAPRNVSVTQSSEDVLVSWDSLSGYEPSIAGYKVKYGTTSGSYTSTIDVGNALTTNISGLTAGERYYFVIVGYDNDLYTTTETSNSDELSLQVSTPTPSPSSEERSASSLSSFTSTQAPICTEAVPVGEPDFFQITRNKAATTLYFTPVNDNVANYHVIYGLWEGDERFGSLSNPVTKDMNNGVQSLTISDLNPKSEYWFKVAPVNGCAVGTWSSWMKAGKWKNKETFFYRYFGI